MIDVGSNTARFVVFEGSMSGSIRAVFETKEVPRLGEGTDPDGRLSVEAVRRGTKALQSFAKTIRGLGVARTLAVATSAVRDAPNGPDFVRTAARRTGIMLRIISGAEEARYGYLGVASSWELYDHLVCDLGGGSLQVAQVRRGRLQRTVSLPLGVLRLTQQFFDHDPPKHREWEEMRDHVRESLRSTLEGLDGGPYQPVGVGGTIRALARAATEFREWPVGRIHGYSLWGHDVDALGEILGEMEASRRKSIPGIGNDRADVVLAGIVVVKELLRLAGADHVLVSGTGIREGIALEAVGARLPAPAEALAERSAAAAAEQFNFRLDHGREVAETAVAAFTLLARRKGWGSRESLALRVAAWMHDSGIAIDLWRHARHSAYLIQNYPIAGLSQREVLLAAMTAYLHEGGPLPSEWKKDYQPVINGNDIEIARQLGALLEAAELTSELRPRFRLSDSGGTLRVAFFPPAGTSVPPRMGDKVAKALARPLEVEVRVRAA